MKKPPPPPEKNEVSIVRSSAAKYLTFVAATGLWANLSEGRCQFVMVKDKRWDWIEEVLK